jgi:hypothetical protein
VKSSSPEPDKPRKEFERLREEFVERWVDPDKRSLLRAGFHAGWQASRNEAEAQPISSPDSCPMCHGTMSSCFDDWHRVKGNQAGSPDKYREAAREICAYLPTEVEDRYIAILRRHFPEPVSHEKL